MYYTNHYGSPLGDITMASDGEMLTGLWFEGQRYFAATLPADHAEKNLELFSTVKLWLDKYFDGKEPDFTPPLYPQATDFRRLVYDILMTVPYGCTTTYSHVAEKVAKKRGIVSISARPVGNAIAHNPISIIIPCHRVIGSDGSLTGYAGGIDKKKILLELEKKKSPLKRV